MRAFGEGTPAVKAPCKIAAFGPVHPHGAQVIAGVQAQNGDRVLLMAQPDARMNGIWLCRVGDWKRASDFDIGAEAAPGTLVMVASGSDFAAAAFYRIATSAPGVIGSNELVFERALVDDSGSASYLAPGAGTVQRSVADALADHINVFDFMSPEQARDVRRGTMQLDVTAAIQNAVDHAIYQGSVTQVSRGKVLMPAGIYRVSDTIHLGYGTSYTSVVLEGEGMRYDSAVGFCGTAIVPTFDDRPCIAFQGGRSSVVRNLSLKGRNQRHVERNLLGTIQGPANGIDDLLEENWVDPALPASASSRYAPYSGIAIDPYSGPRARVSYPDVRYPSFLGRIPQYDKKFSSNCLIENVDIAGFVVGAAIQPCDADGNADYTKLHRVAITSCQFGISIGNSQSRLVHVEDGTVVRVHTGFVTARHGRQNGKPQIHVKSTEIGVCIHWLNVPNLSYGGGPRFDCCYGEVIYSLGVIGGKGNGVCSTAFSSCEFAFDGRRARGEPAYTLQKTSPNAGMTTFESCTFGSSGMPSRFHFGGSSRTYRFIACNNVATQSAESLYEKFALNSTAGVTFDRLEAEPADFVVQNPFTWNLDSGSVAGSRVYASPGTGTRETLVCVYSRSVASLSSPGDGGVPVRLGSNALLRKSEIRGDIIQAGRAVTFEADLSEDALIQMGGEAGDCVWDSETGTLFYVRLRRGSTIFLQAQTNYTSGGQLRSTLTRSGNFHFLNCRNYSTTRFLQGDAAMGSNVITNCGSDDGRAFAEKDVAVGDFVAVFPEVDNALGTARGANRIVASDARARTITTAAKWIADRPKKRLAIFWRKAP